MGCICSKDIYDIRKTLKNSVLGNYLHSKDDVIDFIKYSEFVNLKKYDRKQIDVIDSKLIIVLHGALSVNIKCLRMRKPLKGMYNVNYGNQYKM